MNKIRIQVYVCVDSRCRNVEEYQEQSPHVRHCSRCGKLLKPAGTRTAEG